MREGGVASAVFVVILGFCFVMEGLGKPRMACGVLGMLILWFN